MNTKKEVRINGQRILAGGLILFGLLGLGGPVPARLKAAQAESAASLAQLQADIFETDIPGLDPAALGDPAAIAAALKTSLGKAPASLAVDYPGDRSLFPPDMCSPTFLFRDPDPKSNQWIVRVSAAGAAGEVFVLTDGRQPEKVLDSRAQAEVNEWSEPVEQRTAKAWTPSERIWGTISRTFEQDITVRIYGLEAGEPAKPDPARARLASLGQVIIRVSKDPVGAPIFYRDVPLMPNRNVKGVIEPLAQDAVPLICWRLRDLRKPASEIVLPSMPTCGNCHSFSDDGRVLGMDMDGPSGDKGAYAIVPVQKKMAIRPGNVISWNSFRRNRPTFGLFSRVSPDGRYVVSGVDEAVYVVNYLDFRFLQTFYPTRSILAIYDKETGKIQALPGADDPRYVQANAVWSPDGQTIVFIRAEARDNFVSGTPMAQQANDPNENQIRYDLYAIPFNGGKGGTAAPLAGGSENGKSNSFAKFSPDGKWIVYVQAANGLLMRPDSQLFIIPAKGGTARRLSCNLPLMNSWHSWSPNSRWLVFSSKAQKPFTEMFLTHIDENGNDSPAILVPNSTAFNRAVNIPEFVNTERDGIQEILVPAVEYRLHLDAGEEFLRQKDYAKAMASLEKAKEMKPGYSRTLVALGYALSEKGDQEGAIQYYRQAIELDPSYLDAYVYLGSALLKKGDVDGGLKLFESAASQNPMHFNSQSGLARALAIKGRTADALVRFEIAMEINPDDIDNRYNYGLALMNAEQFVEAAAQLAFVVEKNPQAFEAVRAYAAVLNRTGAVLDAIRYYEEALKLSPDDAMTLNNLAWILATAPDSSMRNGVRALDLAEKLCAGAGFETPATLDTLAAALAQAGKFADAVRWQARSLEMTPASAQEYGIRSQLLELYKEKKTFPAIR